MKKSLLMLISLFFLLGDISIAFSKDVHVKGYYRKDGTYVRSHIRSAPDSSKANNYGPSRSSSELMDPQSRDSDGDGISNYLDNDDDNDGIMDDQDDSQY